jgi:hypothetical protein
MLIVLDDVFNNEIRNNILNYCLNYYVFGQIHTSEKKDLNIFLYKILKIAEKYFDLQSMKTCEHWVHNNETTPSWHFDKNEKLYMNSQGKQYEFPLCSIVYYAQIENLIGGKFITEYEQVIPKNNRLILFSPGIYHSVEPSTGTRISLSMNPWS